MISLLLKQELPERDSSGISNNPKYWQMHLHVISNLNTPKQNLSKGNSKMLQCIYQLSFMCGNI